MQSPFSWTRTAVVLPLLGVAWTGTALGQTPHNRAIAQIAVTPLPVAGGLYDITVEWSFTVEPATTPFDFSTELVLHVNGVQVDVESASIQVDAGSSGCIAPPCSGTCGSASSSGSAATLFCFKDGPCTPLLCDCDCGYWLSTTFPGQALSQGDEISVLLRPAPGALPDGDTGDNQLEIVFHGQPIGWNRGIEQVQLVPTGSHTYDVHVQGSVGWEARAGYANLDFTLELLINGVAIVSQSVPAELDGVLDQTCWQQGCGSTCGNVNGVPRYCDPYLWWDCGCVGGWISIFPGVGMSAGDEVSVLLRPAPGALPELPGLEGDDEAGGAGLAVREMSADARRWRLAQNQPNPFSHLTSIQFDLAEGGLVRVDVFDVGGRKVSSLLDRTLAAGRWSVTWDGQTDRGTRAPSGMYVYRLSTPRGNEARTMTILR